MPFQHPTDRLTIGSLDNNALVVTAQYNPKELQLDKSVTWLDHPELVAEYKGRAPRTATIELLFDGYERDISVQAAVDLLETLSSPRDPDSPREALRRPHLCVIAWGSDGPPPLRCVIEQLSTKYTMFGETGVPLRATCTVRVKEIDLAKMWKRE